MCVHPASIRTPTPEMSLITTDRSTASLLPLWARALPPDIPGFPKLDVSGMYVPCTVRPASFARLSTVPTRHLFASTCAGESPVSRVPSPAEARDGARSERARCAHGRRCVIAFSGGHGAPAGRNVPPLRARGPGDGVDHRTGPAIASRQLPAGVRCLAPRTHPDRSDSRATPAADAWSLCMEECRKSLRGKRAEREPSKMEGGGSPVRPLASSNSSVGIKCSVG